MTFHQDRSFRQIFHPYVFLLKENQGISNDLLDYSLWMMRLSPETIHSPKDLTPNPTVFLDIENEFHE